jgi:4-hydroxy-tetrahydrodipicolinate synthase
VLYNIPRRRNHHRHDLPFETHNITAVKHATGSMDGSELRIRSDIEIISGDDSMTFPLAAVGGVGLSVLANLVPKTSRP